MKILRVIFKNGATFTMPVGEVKIDEDFVFARILNYGGTAFSHHWLRNSIASFQVGRSAYATH